MDLTKYYPDIVAKYPAYVTKRELCEICHICPKTAYNLEQQGEIPYTIEQNHLIRSHKIKLTDILAYWAMFSYYGNGYWWGDKGIPAQPEDMDAYFALEKQIMEKHHLKEPFEWE